MSVCSADAGPSHNQFPHTQRRTLEDPLAHSSTIRQLHVLAIRCNDADGTNWPLGSIRIRDVTVASDTSL